MSAAEAPKSEQIQANVAAALSRLRGELGAASSPVASPTPIPLPKSGAEPAPAAVEPSEPLPAGPVRTPETSAVRPFEPILNAMSGNPPSNGNDAEPVKAEPVKPDLFGRLRADPSLATDRATAAAMINAKEEGKADSQPDLLTGMEVPPAPPPPLGSFEAEDEVNGRGRRMRNRLLVLLALVLIGGGAAWAWVSSHRAPEGPVPVIAADTTPEKVKPEDEGGMQVPNQNVEILNGQSTTAEQPAVLPPPEQPVAPPTTETTDMANAEAQAPAITDAPKPAEPTPTAPEATDAAPAVDAPAIPSVSAPDPAQTAAATPPAPVVPEPVVPEPTTQQAEPAPADPTVAATPSAPAAQAEEPAAAPDTSSTASTAEAPEPAPAKPAEPTQTAAAAAKPAAPTVAPTAGGGSRIQLAAVKSEAIAKSEWAKLQKAHPSLLGGLTLNVEAVDRNGAKLYRIQAGPLTKAQAKDLCTQLKAQKQDCIVAK
jgi:hypothetical protein